MYRVVFTPESRNDLHELHAYITRHASSRVAARYLARLKAVCLELGPAPHRGELRDGMPLDQRSIGFERRVSIVFVVEEAARRVIIVGIRSGGRSVTARTSEPSSE